METENKVENPIPTPADVAKQIMADKGMSAQLEEALASIKNLSAENESLKSQLSKTRSEAAKHRIGRREANEQSQALEKQSQTLEKQSQTLEQRIAQLEQENAANRLEVERVRCLQAENLPVELGELLGNDPESFQHRAGLLRSHMKPSPAGQEKPLGVENLSGGLNPEEKVDPFDPTELIRNRRRR